MKTVCYLGRFRWCMSGSSNLDLEQC
uniref:Uncharacterized protein n=1 Tax=Arundo donax TaxID=35708 RepID=A0A0A8YG48_ARUDO